MSRYLQSRCIDINSPHCPCILASTNHCVFCAQLQGKELCDCNWSGVCILYEKKWNARNDLLGENAKPPRPEIECRITDKQYIAEHTYRIELEVPPALAASLVGPGTFVFLRRASDPQYFHIPIGVMEVSGADKIVVVVEGIGPKSVHVIEEDYALMVRGPYKNGLFGLPWVEKLTYGTALLIAGGMGQPPALPVAEKLVKNYNKVTAILSPGGVGFIGDESMEMWGIAVNKVESLRRRGYQLFTDLLSGQRWDIVISCGPDAQHFAVIDAMHSAGIDLPMAATNNNIMCCGEGICGSCDKETKDNKRVRSCKVQLDITDLKRE